MFDGIEYFKRIASENKRCIEEGYCITTCSGPSGIEGVMENFRRASRFVLIDDTTSGSVKPNRAGGFFNRRTFTVFIMSRHERGSMESYEREMSECRELYLSLLSRVVRDAQHFRELDDVYIALDSIYYREPGPYAANGAAGLYFMLPIDEPVDLRYNEEEWEV